MKKIVVILLLVIYSTTTISGAVIYTHYCMSKFAGWSFSAGKGKSCGECGMKRATKKNGCCKDEYKILKTHKEHPQVETPYQFNPMLIAAIVPGCFNCTVTTFSTAVVYPKNNAPPHKHGVPVYILNCTFRI